MIKETNALKIFAENLERTNMLISAMEKISGYDHIYQEGAYRISSEFGQAVKESQNDQLRKIENSCAEHAVISLSTLFETYLKGLLQELLHRYPNYFLQKQTKYSLQVEGLIKDKKINDYEEISETLELTTRFQYIKFLEIYDLDLLGKTERSLVEYIYIYRNCYVHNAGKLDSKTKAKLERVVPPIRESSKTTNSKLLRTKMKRLIPRMHELAVKKIKET